MRERPDKHPADTRTVEEKIRDRDRAARATLIAVLIVLGTIAYAIWGTQP